MQPKYVECRTLSPAVECWLHDVDLLAWIEIKLYLCTIFRYFHHSFEGNNSLATILPHSIFPLRIECLCRTGAQHHIHPTRLGLRLILKCHIASHHISWNQQDASLPYRSWNGEKHSDELSQCNRVALAGNVPSDVGNFEHTLLQQFWSPGGHHRNNYGNYD